MSGFQVKTKPGEIIRVGERITIRILPGRRLAIVAPPEVKIVHEKAKGERE